MLIGIVGAPNAGKSTFFKAATMQDVKIANYPFTTIEPNVGVGYVTKPCVCKEFGVKCNPKNSLCKNGTRYIPIKLIDVAGLVPGAHEGRGMGNKFLDDLRQADALIHVVDFSGKTDAEGRETEGYDPLETIRFLEREIDEWFASIIKKGLEKYEKKVRYAKVDVKEVLQQQLSGLNVPKEVIEEALEKIGMEDLLRFASYIRKKTKPMVIVANKIDLSEAKQNFERIRKELPDVKIIPACADCEVALKNAAKSGLIQYDPLDGFKMLDESKLTEKQKKALEYIDESVIKPFGCTGVQKALNTAVFEVLGYIAVYPVADANKLSDKDGNILPDVFLVKQGTTLKEFAYKVHTEMGEKFICGIDARTKKMLGADYVLKDDDVIEIKFGK